MEDPVVQSVASDPDPGSTRIRALPSSTRNGTASYPDPRVFQELDFPDSFHSSTSQPAATQSSLDSGARVVSASSAGATSPFSSTSPGWSTSRTRVVSVPVTT
jgi:hypothetical protein